MASLTKKYGLIFLIPFFAILFNFWLWTTPSRAEIAVLISVFIMVPSLIYPKIALYYLIVIQCFIPVIRRLYYLIEGRPNLDFLMLIADGALISMVAAVVMIWVKNKQKNENRFSIVVAGFFVLLFLKIFLLQNAKLLDGAYSFKYYGIYILFYFAIIGLVNHVNTIERIIHILAGTLVFVAFYSIKQLLFGYFYFERLWLDTITFTTMFIDGKIRTFSTLVSPAALSDAMSILFLIGFYYLFQKGANIKIIGFFCMCVSIPPLLFATVRTNWAASMFSLWLFIFCLVRFKKAFTIANFILMPLMFYAVLNFSNIGSDADNMQAQQNLNADNQSISDVMIKNRTSALINPLEEYSMQKRIDTWTLILFDAYYKYPLGQGLGAVGYAHSLYFQILGETGFLGIAIFLILIIWTVIRGVSCIKLAPTPQIHKMSSLCFSLFITICILNLTGNHLNAHPADVVFWLSIGALNFIYYMHILPHKKARLLVESREQQKLDRKIIGNVHA